jgi:hypothetical protein
VKFFSHMKIHQSILELFAGGGLQKRIPHAKFVVQNMPNPVNEEVALHPSLNDHRHGEQLNFVALASPT